MSDDLIADDSEWHNLEVARRSLAEAEQQRLEAIRMGPRASGDRKTSWPTPPPLSANSPETRAYWDSLHTDLAELELRDALGGIRAIVTERLRQVRAPARPHPVGTNLVGEVESDVVAGDYAQAAALLAAEIDRIEGARP